MTKLITVCPLDKCVFTLLICDSLTLADIQPTMGATKVWTMRHHAYRPSLAPCILSPIVLYIHARRKIFLALLYGPIMRGSR